MKLSEIKLRIASIKAVLDDSESCHAQEDDLYTDFIVALSKWEIPVKDIQKLSKEVLKTRALDFSRWCA